MTVTRTKDGLLLREDFTSLARWSGSAAWQATAKPSMVSFGHVATLLGPGASGSAEYDGVREAHLHVESGVWHMLYDAGDGVGGWRQFFAVSYDRGLTWTRLGQVTTGLSDGAGGTYAATATGWVEKRGSTYHLHRVTTNTTFAPPDTGLPGNPYGWDQWTGPSITGPWTYVRKTTPPAATDFDASIVLGTVINDGGQWHVFITGNKAAADVNLGHGTGPGPTGPWTIDAAALWPAAYFAPHYPEDPKVFWHAGLGRWVMTANAIINGHTERCLLLVSNSASITDWPAAPEANYVQAIGGPIDGAGLSAMGVASHVTGPDGALIEHDGYVPLTYDGLPRGDSPGWHRGRSLLSTILEPSTHALTITDASSAQQTITTELAHTDFTAEWTVKLRGTGPTNLGLWYRLTGTAETSNCYRLVVRGGMQLLLQKVVSGSPVTVQNAVSGLAAALDNGHNYRIKVKVEGTRHRAWVDGELQIDSTDATYATGTHLALSSYNLNADVRLLRLTSNDTVTLTGLTPGQSVVLRAAGDLPADTVVADGSGVALFQNVHGPLRAFEINGADYIPTGGIWPGDAYAFGHSRPRSSLAAVR